MACLLGSRFLSNAMCRRMLHFSPVRSSILNVKTKLPHDVIMFKYENPKFFRVLNTFGLVQFGLMMYMSHFVFTTLRNAPVKQTEPDEKKYWWYKVNLGDKAYRNSFATLCAVLGCLVLCGSWMFTLRSVRYLILKKKGDSVAFVTYTPFGQNRITTVPLSKVSSQESRANAKVQLPIKVKGHAFHYLVDMKGEFVNKDLFDATVGLQRRLL